MTFAALIVTAIVAAWFSGAFIGVSAATAYASERAEWVRNRNTSALCLLLAILAVVALAVTR